MKFSPSMIRTWMKCGLQAKFNYIDQIPQQQNAAASLGSAVHLALESYNESGDEIAAIELFKDAWDRPAKYDIEPEIWPARTSFGSYREKGIKMLEEYFENYRWSSDNTLAQELRFCVPFGKHELSGIVDQLSVDLAARTIKVIDYKSGYRPAIEGLHLDVQFCADEETEILSKRGWLSYDRLVQGEDVLTLNTFTGMAEWQPADSVHVFNAINQKLISFEGKAHSSLTTANHRWPVKHYVSSAKGWRIEDRFVESRDLTGSDRIICAAPVDNLPTEKKHADELVEIIAWFWTEGHNIRGGSISLAQSESKNPDCVKRIRESLETLYGPPRSSLRNGKQSLSYPAWREAKDADCSRFYLNRFASTEIKAYLSDPDNKVVSSQFISELTESQLKLFIDVSFLADGHEKPEYRIITQSIKERLDPLQMACSLVGIRTSLRSMVIKGNGPYAGREFWGLSLKPKRPFFVTTKNLKSEKEYTGSVWCPTTQNETWYARRRGHVYFTGNTSYIYAASRKEFWTGVPGSDKYVGLQNGAELYEKYKDFDIIGIWLDLRNSKSYDVGPRGHTDIVRLYRCCDEIERAIEHEVFVPSISGDSCRVCSYKEICPAYVFPEDSGKDLF